MGAELECVTSVADKRTLSKLLTTMDNGSHPLYSTVIQQKSLISWGLRSLTCKFDSYKSPPSGIVSTLSTAVPTLRLPYCHCYIALYTMFTGYAPMHCPSLPTTAWSNFFYFNFNIDCYLNSQLSTASAH